MKEFIIHSKIDDTGNIATIVKARGWSSLESQIIEIVGILENLKYTELKKLNAISRTKT